MGGCAGGQIKTFTVTLCLSKSSLIKRAWEKTTISNGKSMRDTSILGPRSCVSMDISKESHILLPSCLRDCTNSIGLFPRNFRVASLRSEDPRKQEWVLPRQFEGRVLYSDSLKPPANPPSILWGMDTKRNKSLWPIFSMTCIWNSPENHT